MVPIPVIVPIRFYGFDTAIYAFAAIIGFAIAYKACRLHEFSGKREHLCMATAFTILSMSLATLALTSGYTYFSYFTQGSCCVFDQIFSIDDVGYWIYFIASVVSYSLLAISYMPKTKKGLLLPAVFMTTTYFSYFNVLLFFLMSFVAFNATKHWYEKKNLNSGLVASGFLLIAAYHAALPFAMFSKLLYVAGHFGLVLGFAALLVMLIRTTK
ncbi:MAG: hypothetical protein V1887_01485 [Candidatus Aenigmatarchaeota archaeon]